MNGWFDQYAGVQTRGLRTYSSRNEKGDRFIVNDGEAKLGAMLDILLEMLRRYSETGRRLGMGDLARACDSVGKRCVVISANAPALNLPRNTLAVAYAPYHLVFPRAAAVVQKPARPAPRLDD
jgi:hypothetical protein